MIKDVACEAKAAEKGATRQVNPLPTLKQCREITSKISGVKIGSSHMFAFNSKNNTGGVKREHEMYIEPVPSKKNKISTCNFIIIIYQYPYIVS